MKRIFTVALCLCLCGCSSATSSTAKAEPNVSAASTASASTPQAPEPEEEADNTYTDEEMETAFCNLTKYTDEFKPGYATYMYPVEIPAYKKNRKVRATVSVELYINTDPENHARLCACTEYKGKSWVFFDDILFLADEEIYTIHVKRRDKTEKVSSSALEKYSWVLSDDDIAMFEQLVTCAKRKLKLQGKDSFFVYEFSDESITSISEVLDAYKKLTSS